MHFSSTWLLLLGVPLLPVSEGAGIRMAIRYGGAGDSSQHTTYLHSDRKRMEYRNSFGQKQSDGSVLPIYGPRLVSITRCDLGQTFELNLDTSEYTSAPYPPELLTKSEMERRGLQVPATYLSENPTLRIEVTTTDTGERKEIFGHIARHVITTRKQIPLEGSHSEPQESATDAWYIDLDQRLSCDRKWPEGKRVHAYTRAVLGKQPMERPEFADVGEPERGFALQSLMISRITHTLPDGTRKQTDSTSEVLVTQLEEGPLDPALFEIPPGFKHVEQIERNPVASASSSQIKDFWQRLTARVASLFNR